MDAVAKTPFVAGRPSSARIGGRRPADDPHAEHAANQWRAQSTQQAAAMPIKTVGSMPMAGQPSRAPRTGLPADWRASYAPVAGTRPSVSPTAATRPQSAAHAPPGGEELAPAVGWWSAEPVGPRPRGTGTAQQLAAAGLDTHSLRAHRPPHGWRG
uniref:Uncharacterized protein n=1 Tax=Prymnesium polylepis TaxID=72548 RepID=A0A7S4HJ36_9EUKA